MKTLDYFMENYVTPILDGLTDIADSLNEVAKSFVLHVANVLLAIILLLTLPLWIIPYKAKKKKQERREEGDEVQKQKNHS